MKANPVAWALLCIILGLSICAAENRYVTLSVGGTNQTDQLTIQGVETARMISACDHLNPEGVFGLTVAKSSFSISYDNRDLQGYALNPYNNFIPPKSIVVAGPATFTLLSNYGSNSRDTNQGAFITFEILPATSSVDKTVIVPPQTNKVEITLESSTNLVSWATATNGVYGSPDEARFFRIHLRRLD